MKITAICLCSLLILTAPGFMAQQTTVTNQSWDVLRQLQPGGKLEIESKTVKKKVSGKFVRVSDTELVIERKRKNVSFSRDEVKTIWSVAPPSRKKRAILTAIGGGVGVFFGLIAFVGIIFSEGGSEAGAYAALIGIPVGAGLAGYYMAGSGERTLIYYAP
jgi:hypothetical protein